MSFKVTHITTVHGRYDTRIFIKMCMSLSKKNYDVSLIVADGKGNEISDGITIYDVGAASGRLDRIFNVAFRTFKLAKILKSDLYHIHDPELIPTGVKLGKYGYRVIFDAHEDVPKQILTKPYLNKISALLISKIFKIYEFVNCRKFNGIIAATPSIYKKFKKINKNVVVINNYPLLNELSDPPRRRNKKMEICYIGALTSARGIKEIFQALNYTSSNVRLNLCGDLNDEPGLAYKIGDNKSWKKVNYFGVVGRQQVREILSRSIAGLVTFHPTPNHINALPTKMFEYMSASIPIVLSNFEQWKEFIDENKCGIIVDPMNPHEIASVIERLLTDPKLAFELGHNGRIAIEKKYNWEAEFFVLENFYQAILNKTQ